MSSNRGERQKPFSRNEGDSRVFEGYWREYIQEAHRISTVVDASTSAYHESTAFDALVAMVGFGWILHFAAGGLLQDFLLYGISSIAR